MQVHIKYFQRIYLVLVGLFIIVFIIMKRKKIVNFKFKKRIRILLKHTKQKINYQDLKELGKNIKHINNFNAKLQNKNRIISFKQKRKYLDLIKDFKLKINYGFIKNDNLINNQFDDLFIYTNCFKI